MIKINRNNLLSSKKMSIENAYDLFVKSRETACAKATIDSFPSGLHPLSSPRIRGFTQQ